MDADIQDLFMFPPYWLVYALPWPDPDVSMAEAAFALAPACVPKKGLPNHVTGVLGVAEIYAREHPGERMIWFSDITSWLSSKDKSWAYMRIDWEDALLTIPRLQILGLYMTISRRAHSHLSNAGSMTLVYGDGTSEELTEQERWKVHEAFIDQLERDWPKFITGMIRSGRLTVN